MERVDPNMVPPTLTPEQIAELEAAVAAVEPAEWDREPNYYDEGGWFAVGPHRECNPDDEDDDTDEPGSPCHKRAQADQRLARLLVAYAPALLASARRLGEVQMMMDTIAHVVGAVHDQSTGPSYPGDSVEVLAATRTMHRQLTAANARVAELEDALNRDRTGLASALGKIVDEVKGRGWIADGRGSYEWDDDRYRNEAGEGFAAVKKIAVDALARSGTIANEVLMGRTPIAQKLRDERDAATQRADAAEARLGQALAAKDDAYTERNRLVAAFARAGQSLGWTVGVGEHEDKPGEDWDPEWRSVVYIDTPEGQASWHVHDSQRWLFNSLPSVAVKWDGHTTEEKYDRLNRYVDSVVVSDKERADAAEDKLVVARDACALALRWLGDADDPNATFEDIGEWYQRDTGRLRPGKSLPMEMAGESQEERERRFRAWCDDKAKAVRAALVLALPAKAGGAR
jgi:hypothetical protein